MVCYRVIECEVQDQLSDSNYVIWVVLPVCSQTLLFPSSMASIEGSTLTSHSFSSPPTPTILLPIHNIHPDDGNCNTC